MMEMSANQSWNISSHFSPLSDQGMQNFGLSSILATYMRGLESEGVEWGAELRERRFQAAWRSTHWDCELSERWGNGTTPEQNGRFCYVSKPVSPELLFVLRSDKANHGFHESLFCALQALRDKEFCVFDDTLKRARYGGTPETSKFGPKWLSFYSAAVCPPAQGGWGGGALQRHSRGCVLSVSGPEEPAEHQGAGERQTALR